MKSDVSARRALYSGRYRPAWRMNQIGGRCSCSPARTLRKGLWDEGDAATVGWEAGKGPVMEALKPHIGQGSSWGFSYPYFEEGF